jgi:hypothetical protein
MEMIVSKITGGLGNQMFQYAIAKAIAKKRNDKFKLDISFYPNQTLRKYELNYFKIEEDIATNHEIEILGDKASFWFKIKRKLGITLSSSMSYCPEKESTILDTSVFNYTNGIYLDGYWQNEGYFKEIRYELLKDFTLKNEISNEARKYLENIKNNNSISLHVRRGDYIQVSHTNSIHGTCDLIYYKKATDYINKCVKNSHFYIFSDDIDWCKQNFIFLKNKVFIDDTNSAFDDLELMKNCKHNIIANSTFSWWSAWLNENNDKIIISPAIWWKTMPSKNISCDNWIKL